MSWFYTVDETGGRTNHIVSQLAPPAFARHLRKLYEKTNAEICPHNPRRYCIAFAIEGDWGEDTIIEDEESEDEDE